MKRFGTLFLAAVLGSVSTIATFQWIDNNKEEGVKVEYLNGVPASKVPINLMRKGKSYPLILPPLLKKLCRPWFISGPHKTAGRREEQTQYIDPFREFFRPAGTARP